MSWLVYVILNSPGNKSESEERVGYDSRAEADAAIETLKLHIRDAGADDFLTLSSSSKRIDFLKQDFRRVGLRERHRSNPGGAVA